LQFLALGVDLRGIFLENEFKFKFKFKFKFNLNLV